jgi:transcriptional regulator with XRE-family HTH domain
MTTFGERLRELREAAKMTQEQLAARSGVNVYTIRGYEQGRREPSWKAVFDLTAGLGVSSETFRGCTEAEAPAGRGAGRPPKAREEAPEPPPKRPRRRPKKGGST